MAIARSIWFQSTVCTEIVISIELDKGSTFELRDELRLAIQGTRKPLLKGFFSCSMMVAMYAMDYFGNGN
ncbi:MAG: hypothetical protein HKP37_12320 [Boseongicola sp.]|nr:hypothetical protein [Boseongicola sp.]